MEDYFKPESFYHVYFHAVGQDKLFKNKENYRYFLEKYKRFILPHIKTYSYALMPNHVHFLIKTKSSSENNSDKNFNNFITDLFGKLKNSYTKSFNMSNQRYGSLFTRTTKRKHIDNENYFKNIIAYINNNPVHHKYCKSADEWDYCSYSSMLSSKPTDIQREEVISVFDGAESFIEFHKKTINISDELSMES